MRENSIEKDIKILKSIIKINNDYLKGVENQTINQKEIKALEHVLSDYKRVLKENEQLRTEVNSLKKENEELREKWNKDTHILQNELDLTNADKINNYIPVQKVKDKIEEYKDMCISNANGYKNYFKDNYNELVFRRMEQLEKELLEESEENNNEKNL